MGPKDREPRKLLQPDLTANLEAFGISIIGQDRAVASFASLLNKIRSGVRTREPRPIDVKLLAGPSGVGKTGLVYRLAEILAEDFPEQNDLSKGGVLRIDGGEYSSTMEASRLIGSPPGYIGSKDGRWQGGTEALLSQQTLSEHTIWFKDRKGRKQGITILLVDEVEKLDKSVRNTLLAVMQEGQIRIADNSTVDFSDVVILMTSNAGNRDVENLRIRMADRSRTVPAVFDRAFEREGVVDFDPEVARIYERAIMREFTPEFRGRVAEVLIFNSLASHQLEAVAAKFLWELEDDLRGSGLDVALQADDEAIRWLVDKSYDPSRGARALKNFIDNYVRARIIDTIDTLEDDSTRVNLTRSEESDDLDFNLGDAQQATEEVKLNIAPDVKFG